MSGWWKANSARAARLGFLLVEQALEDVERRAEARSALVLLELGRQHLLYQVGETAAELRDVFFQLRPFRPLVVASGCRRRRRCRGVAVVVVAWSGRHGGGVAREVGGASVSPVEFAVQ